MHKLSNHIQLYLSRDDFNKKTLWERGQFMTLASINDS